MGHDHEPDFEEELSLSDDDNQPLFEVFKKQKIEHKLEKA